MTPTDPLWDDPFLGLAFQSFVEEAREQQGWPDSREVKRRTYEGYEAELAAKNAGE